jgi:hypothetical protein
MKIANARTSHTYRWATADEKKSLFKKLQQDRWLNQLLYKQRFSEGANQRRPRYLHYSAPIPLAKPAPLRTLFHEGILKDEQGVFWIIKKFNPGAHADSQPRKARNSPRYERLAYLLARGRANYAEIRHIHPGELATPGSCKGALNQYYLTRVSTDMNGKPALAHKSPADAFAAIWVANVFMRKWDQHLDNFAFIGDVPVAIDHDMIGPPVTFPHSPAGMSTFSLAFLSFKLIATMSHLEPRHAVDVRAKERFQHHFVRQNHREAWMVMRDLIDGLGLGAGVIRAEGLQASAIARAIANFKTLPPIQELAKEAGFEGRELDHIVSYLNQSQKCLGSDIKEIWRRLSGENTRFDQLD